MERNDDFGNSGLGGSTGGSGNLGGSNAGSTGGAGFGSSGAYDSTSGTGAGSTGYGSGATGGSGYGSAGTGGIGGSSGTSGETLADRASGAKDAAAEKLGQAKDMAGERLGQVKEKASELKATLADRLEAGAEKLRQRNTSGLYAGAGAGAVATDDRMAMVGNRLADGLQSTADFLREGDLAQSIETQVKEHPGRTLLIALGLGYVIGKAFRR